MNDLWVHQYQSLTLGNKFLHFFVPSFWSKLLRSTAIETWNQKESIEKRSGKDALKLVFKRLARTKKESYSLTLNEAEGGGVQKCPLDTDKASIPSIFIKTSQNILCISCLMSAFTKIFFGKLRMIEIGPRGALREVIHFSDLNS